MFLLVLGDRGKLDTTAMQEVRLFQRFSALPSAGVEERAAAKAEEVAQQSHPTILPTRELMKSHEDMLFFTLRLHLVLSNAIATV